ncbi:hypothetical protein [Clostridium butyricum]|uniref:hypothetical protein n=1 Tax=Clostridium butyricum TaxID=1492 RepID=UPI002ABD5950|nr:hypothetical protein [Clostridium butyricum]
MKKKLFKNMYVLTGKDMSTCTKVYPYYSEEEYRMMTNDDIMNKLTLLKKQKDKFGVDVNALNGEMQELKRELEKRTKKVLIREVEQYVECCDDINNKKLVISKYIYEMGNVVVTLKFLDKDESLNYYLKDSKVEIEVIEKIGNAINEGYELIYMDMPTKEDVN